MAPRKPTITMSSRADAAKTANVALLRRLQGNPHASGTRALPLKTPEAWHCYVANTYNDANELHLMRERGWEPVTVEDLACSVQDSGFRLSEDGHLVRGPQGQEVVFKMPAADYALLQEAKARANMRGIGSAAKIKADMANAANASLGGEAAEYIHGLEGEVVDRLSGEP